MHGLAARIDFLGVGVLGCDTVSLGEPHELGGLKMTWRKHHWWASTRGGCGGMKNYPFDASGLSEEPVG